MQLLCESSFRFLESHQIKFQRIPIVDTPPTRADLAKMLGYLKDRGETFKKLFNTSGVLYRDWGISEKIKKGMSEDEAPSLLAQNGKLIKRPFLLLKDSGTVGFQEAQWKELLGL